MSARIVPQHSPKTLREMDMPMDGFDEELTINTQSSSQWDSLCHVVHGETGATYNGHVPTKAALAGAVLTEHNTLPTMDQWHPAGCLVARGVLIDFKRFVDETRPELGGFHPMDGHRITVAELEAVAEHQGVEFRPGDVLIVRTGYTEYLEDPKPELFAKMADKLQIAGVHGAVETVRWVWDHRFAAVAGDSPAFEAISAVNEDGTPSDSLYDLGGFQSSAFPSCFGCHQIGETRGEEEGPTDRANSSSQVVPQPDRHVDWRDVGPQGSQRVLQEERPVQLPPDVGAAQHAWPGSIAAERHCCVLSEPGEVDGTGSGTGLGGTEEVGHMAST